MFSYILRITDVNIIALKPLGSSFRLRPPLCSVKNKIRDFTCYVDLVLCCIKVYGPFCHGALKHDISTLFATFFVWTSLQFILYLYHWDFYHSVHMCRCKYTSNEQAFDQRIYNKYVHYAVRDIITLRWVRAMGLCNNVIRVDILRRHNKGIQMRFVFL